MSTDFRAGGSLRQLVGAVEAGPEILPVFPVVVDCLLLHEGVAVEQLQLSVPGTSSCEQCYYADAHSRGSWGYVPSWTGDPAVARTDGRRPCTVPLWHGRTGVPTHARDSTTGNFAH